jgi:hypothetical protein
MHSLPHGDLHGDLPEVDHGRDGADDLHAVRVMIRDTLDLIISFVHYSDAVPAGRQWTIPIGLDCGFDGELVIRVRDAGSCERAPESAMAAAIDIGTKLGRGR